MKSGNAELQGKKVHEKKIFARKKKKMFYGYPTQEITSL